MGAMADCVSHRHLIQRNLYKHAHNHTIILKKPISLGLRYLEASTSEVTLHRTRLWRNISEASVSVRYLDGGINCFRQV